MMKYIKPVIVLSLITTIVSALLIVTYNLTYVDTSGIITDELMEKCIELMGEGDYSIVTDWQEEGYAIAKPDNVEKLIKKTDGSLAFQIVASGYNKNGLDLLIAMNPDGTIDDCELLCDYDKVIDPNLSDKEKAVIGGFTSQISFSVGFVTDLVDGVIKIGGTKGVTDISVNTKGVPCVVYDKNAPKDNVSVGSIAGAKTYYTDGDNCSMVVLHQSYGTPKLFIIYK